LVIKVELFWLQSLTVDRVIVNTFVKKKNCVQAGGRCASCGSHRRGRRWLERDVDAVGGLQDGGDGRQREATLRRMEVLVVTTSSDGGRVLPTSGHEEAFAVLVDDERRRRLGQRQRHQSGRVDETSPHVAQGTGRTSRWVVLRDALSASRSKVLSHRIRAASCQTNQTHWLSWERSRLSCGPCRHMPHTVPYSTAPCRDATDPV